MDRRRLISWLVSAGGLVTAGIVGIPALLAAFVPTRLRRQGERWLAVGTLDDVPLGEVREGRITMDTAGWPQALPAETVYIWRPTAHEAVVYSRKCTDLSCPVTWDGGSGCFFCPCHGGIFARDGRPMAGPPPRPLGRFAVRIQNGTIEIDPDSLRT